MSDTSAIPITALTGPPFTVIIIYWTLFGVLSIQVYSYFQVFINDRPALKALVCGVYVLELAQTLLQTQSSWRKLASGFGNIDGIDEIGTAWLSYGVIGAGIAFLVQWFYASRIAAISQSRMVPTIIRFMSTTSYAGALAASIIAERASKFSVLLANRTKWFATYGVWGASTAICDIMITISMWYYLGKRKNEGLPRTQALLSRIIRMTVETAAITASVSVLSLTLNYIPSLLFDFTVPLSAVANFYAVTMLAVLNSRMKLGVTSESIGTWRDNDLVFAMSHSRDMNNVDVGIVSSDSALQSTLNVCGAKEQVGIPTVGAKINSLV